MRIYHNFWIELKYKLASVRIGRPKHYLIFGGIFLAVILIITLVYSFVSGNKVGSWVFNKTTVSGSSISLNSMAGASSGSSGKSGVSGTSGAFGIEGTSGASGVNGISGTSDMDGASGINGSSGTLDAYRSVSGSNKSGKTSSGDYIGTNGATSGGNSIDYNNNSGSTKGKSTGTSTSTSSPKKSTTSKSTNTTTSKISTSSKTSSSTSSSISKSIWTLVHDPSSLYYKPDDKASATKVKKFGGSNIQIDILGNMIEANIDYGDAATEYGTTTHYNFYEDNELVCSENSCTISRGCTQLQFYVDKIKSYAIDKIYYFTPAHCKLEVYTIDGKGAKKTDMGTFEWDIYEQGFKS
jgi:hypothetical protein